MSENGGQSAETIEAGERPTGPSELEALLAEVSARYLGRQVRVPRGTFVRSMHPHDPNTPQPTKRGQTITVHHVSFNQQGDIVLIWAGSGNYWKDVRAKDVELVSDDGRAINGQDDDD